MRRSACSSEPSSVVAKYGLDGRLGNWKTDYKFTIIGHFRWIGAEWLEVAIKIRAGWSNATTHQKAERQRPNHI